LFLCQSQSPSRLANLGADNVCWIFLSRHAEIELDPNGNARFICYASVTAEEPALAAGSGKHEMLAIRLEAGM
jgi:hypothetical protein